VVKVISFIGMIFLELMNMLSIIFRNSFVNILIVTVEILEIILKSLGFDVAVNLKYLTVYVLRCVGKQLVFSTGIEGQFRILEL
jgi:hypothetical protein